MRTNQFISKLTQLSGSFLFCLIITACGFQLRGTENNQLIQAQILLSHSELLNNDLNYVSFERILKRDLNNLDANILTSQAVINDSRPAIQLAFFNITFKNQGISRDATGRANEQEITARLSYQLNHAISTSPVQTLTDQAEPLVLSATASYFQDYRNPSAAEVQKQNTQNLLLQQLSQKLIQQIQFQLNQSAVN